MEGCLRVTMLTEKNSTWTSWWDYDRTKKEMQGIIEMDRWSTNGFFMIKAETERD